MFNEEKFKDLTNKLGVKEGQDTVYMSNRNFTTLHKLLDANKIKSNHIAFTYGYLYFQHYMFRYAKYEEYVPQASGIKEMLGYHSINKAVDYIIKKGGVLDQAGITMTIFDFPVVQEWEDNQPVFTMLSQLNEGNTYGSLWRKEHGIKTNQSCKYPVYAFYDAESEFTGATTHNNGGSFFEMANTTKLDVEVFLYCMSNSDLECTGFYLYSYLKWKCDCTEGEIYGIGYERLARETGLKLSTVKKYIKLLRQYNLINCISGTYVYYGAGEDVNTNEHEPNKYAVNDYQLFTYEKLEDLSKPTYISNAKKQEDKAMTEATKRKVEEACEGFFSKKIS